MLRAHLHGVLLKYLGSTRVKAVGWAYLESKSLTVHHEGDLWRSNGPGERFLRLNMILGPVMHTLSRPFGRQRSPSWRTVKDVDSMPSLRPWHGLSPNILRARHEDELGVSD